MGRGRPTWGSCASSSESFNPASHNAQARNRPRLLLVAQHLYVSSSSGSCPLSTARVKKLAVCQICSCSAPQAVGNSACPFANLPEARPGRWGAGLTAAMMKKCRWVKPVLVGQFEFPEWTADNHLRHSRFVALRDDVNARSVMREPLAGTSGIIRRTLLLRCIGESAPWRPLAPGCEKECFGGSISRPLCAFGILRSDPLRSRRTGPFVRGRAYFFF